MAENVPIAEICHDAISSLHKCQCAEAKYLCIYDIALKLRHSGQYDIGGCVSDEPEIWFQYTTSFCPGNNYLLNIIACKRKPGSVTINISNSNKMEKHTFNKKSITYMKLLENFKSLMFKTTKNDEYLYLTTYNFSSSQVDDLENKVLLIPIHIQKDTECAISVDALKRIKLEHDTSKLFSKKNCDFTVVSSSGKEYPTHKLLLAAHSDIIREMIKNCYNNTLNLDLDESSLELLLQFLYTGTIENWPQHNSSTLLQLSTKYKLVNLFKLTEHMIVQQINIKNAVEIAILSENYQMEHLQTAIFKFIKNHPEALETETWKALDNVVLIKKMFQYIHQ